MKKIFTLLFSLGALTTVFAQSGHNNNSRDVAGRYPDNRSIYNNDQRNDNYSSNSREIQILKINREFDAKIAHVKRDRYLRNGEKNREIRRLEMKRQEQLRMVNARFWNYKQGRYDDQFNKNGKGRY